MDTNNVQTDQVVIVIQSTDGTAEEQDYSNFREEGGMSEFSCLRRGGRLVDSWPKDLEHDGSGQ